MAGAPALILFVSGTPDRGPDPSKDLETSIGGRMSSMFFPVGWRRHRSSPEPSGETPTSETPAIPARLPREEILCTNMVLDLARRSGRSVKVVNLESPGPDRSLIERWVGVDDPLPVLVRVDGARLVGSEHFVPGEVRRFVRGP